MTWRLANSLDQLRREVWSRWPGATVWTIGDLDHAARESDHNPNDDDVVCAVDIVGREKAQRVASRIASSRDRRVKYAIFDGRIISSTVEPWLWRTYDGDNKHLDHIHVSVGRGPSGDSTRPDLYDDASHWGVEELSPEEDDDMPDQELARQVGRLADAKSAEAQVQVARQVAETRAHLGLGVDPVSDAINATEILAGRKTLRGVSEALNDRANQDQEVTA